jgi:DNA-binding response OmpR family regulator
LQSTLSATIDKPRAASNSETGTAKGNITAHNMLSAGRVHLPGKRDLRMLRVLIVDDEIDIAFSLKMGLEQRGFIVDSFTDAEKALSNFSAGVYDVALIDIKMPRINGFELFEKLSSIDEEVKYCFMTAYEVYYESLKKDYSNLDVDCFIKKPIELGNLVTLLRDN